MKRTGDFIVTVKKIEPGIFLEQRESSDKNINDVVNLVERSSSVDLRMPGPLGGR